MGEKDLLGIIPPDAETALHLRENRGKIPDYKENDGTWFGRNKPLSGAEADTSAGEIEKWGSDGAGIGIMTRNNPVFDNDGSDPRIASGLSEIIFRIVGIAPVRGRPNSPRLTHMCKFRGPGFGKKRLVYWPKGTAKPKKPPALEFLGVGQYTNLDGPHPSGVRYEWRNGHPSDDGAELPEVDEEIADQVFTEAQAFLDAGGYETEETHDGFGVNSERRPLGDPSLIAPSPQHVVDLLESWGPRLEENIGQIGHNDFVSATAAIVGSFGKDANEHYQDYIVWCGYIGRDTDPNTAKTWRSFLKGTSVGWSRLCRLAGNPDDTGAPKAVIERQHDRGCRTPCTV